ARYPAPNPLSMLTTLHPEAQEFSMDSSADNPPKLAPYPTLVGTAITGQSTNPPMTDARAPSIPATATIHLALIRSSRWDNSLRSEERRVGKEHRGGRSQSRGAREHA